MNKKYGLANLMGTDRFFFNKVATIKEYFSLVPVEDRRNCCSFDELYQEALKNVEKQDFDINTSDMNEKFQTLTKDMSIIAILIGIIAYVAAEKVDREGKSIETAIDKLLLKDFDKNNPFDVKDGYGHRIFGHDLLTYGLKNIPADTIIKVKIGDAKKRTPIRIGEFLNVGKNGNVSMWDLIWKFYGNDSDKLLGTVNCIKHTFVHLTKDMVTPAGLPVPFISLFNKYEHFDNLDASALRYKDSLMEKCDKIGLQLKASDFVSLFMIEIFIKMYCKSSFDCYDDQNLIEREMKLVAMGTCLSLQMAKMIIGQGLEVNKKGPNSFIPGGKTNLLMVGAFAKNTFIEISMFTKNRSETNHMYKGLGKGER